MHVSDAGFYVLLCDWLYFVVFLISVFVSEISMRLPD